MRGMFKIVLGIVLLLASSTSFATNRVPTCRERAVMLATTYLTYAGEQTVGFTIGPRDLVDLLAFRVEGTIRGSNTPDSTEGVDKVNYHADVAVRFDRRAPMEPMLPAGASRALPATDQKVRFFYSGSMTCEDLRIERVLALGGV